MGVGFHEIKFLGMAARRRGLGDVVTFARQGLNMSANDFAREYGPQFVPDGSGYVDGLLEQKMGATSVSSIDNSDYEGATYVANLNEEVEIGRQFDTVVDCGTSEHIFDIGRAFKNAIKLCRVGGRIVHSLPSNSECGHGFYQVSPELFFSLYSERNGFRDTIVYVFDVMNETSWYRVTRPTGGARAMANSLSATYLLCATEKVADVAAISVQQSDYVQAWDVGFAPHEGRSAVKDRLRRMFKGSAVAGAATLVYRGMFADTGLHRANPHLTKVSIEAEVKGPGNGGR